MFSSFKTSKLNILPSSDSDIDMSSAPYSGLVVVGAGVKMKCETLRCTQLEVLGDVDMHVEAETFVVRESGSFKGTVKTHRAEIQGTAEGVLSVKDRLSIHGTGKVTGDVDYGELAIEAGGQLLGNLVQKGQGSSAPLTTKASPKKESRKSSGQNSSDELIPSSGASDKTKAKSDIKTWYTEDA